MHGYDNGTSEGSYNQNFQQGKAESNLFLSILVGTDTPLFHDCILLHFGIYKY